MESKTYKRSLCWLRRDLRLYDNHALSVACENSEEVVVVFVFDKNILSRLKDSQDRRLTFIYESLKEMNQLLKQVNSRLIVLFGDPAQEIPSLASRLDVETVYVNEDYEGYALRRDKEVAERLSQKNISFFKFKDQVIFSPQEILKSDGKPYQVFTPYKKTWLLKLKPKHYEEFPVNLKKMIVIKAISSEPELKALKAYGFERSEILIPPGQTAGQKLLKSFLPKLKKYDKDRDIPSKHGTSKISVHLRFGTISIREAVRACRTQRNKGAETWLSELIWREFYFMILAQFPHVETKAFKLQYDKILWPGKVEHFKAWCEGKTGFPIVDAGMRQLNQTGFMHNRLRMIVASFLVKDLLLDWQWGEAYFAEKLLDFDLAANNGGWQWCASTGCDAQPYFRIFNPDSQAAKFDPENEFLKQWVPEAFEKSKKYPSPIVDHKVQRNKAIELFKKYQSQ
ncbi:MAG: deoxyribodipyrimidine photo-lyase [Bdellovibrionales bacterium]|nr:deoxyribodipyrimidine photo-lyase [Bdellovibrionales bacterium]